MLSSRFRKTRNFFLKKNRNYQKAIPAANLFNTLYFDSNRNSAENDTYYIGM